MPSIYVYELERWCNRVKRGKKKFGERGLSVWRESEGEKKNICGLSEYRMSSSSQIPAENK